MEIQEQQIIVTIDEVGNRANGAAARALRQVFGNDQRLDEAIRAVMTVYGNFGFRGEVKLIVKNICRQAQMERGQP